MTTVIRRAGTLLLLTGVAACGPAPDVPPAQQGITPPTGQHSSIADPPDDRLSASSVSLVRRGGLKPQTFAVHVAVGQAPPDGFTRSDVVAVLRAASRPALRTAAATTPGQTCCDRYVYTVAIRWTDGTSRSFAAVDGEIHPPALDRVVHLVERAAAG
ncbi:MAG: hypothetical protein ACR2JU_07230 [Nocardioidaceae bacterium]